MNKSMEFDLFTDIFIYVMYIYQVASDWCQEVTMNDQIIGYAEAVIPVLNKTQIDAIEDVTEGKDHDDYDWDANRYHLTAPAQVGGQGGHWPPLEFPESSNITYFCHFEHWNLGIFMFF